MALPLPTGTVTFLFTDIEGSTERWEHHRAAMQGALERHDALLRAAIEAHRGHVFKTVGDAFCAAFHTPLDALGAAVDAQRAVEAEDWSVYGSDFPAIRVRMGIHTGVAQERGGDYFGPPVNRAARLEAAGNGGQVLLSAITRQGVEDRLPAGVHMLDLGEHRLKDLRHSERISQAVVDGLADVTRSLRTAGELGAEDRIVIRDPDDADPDAVAEAPLVVARSARETLATLAAVVRGDARTVVLTPEQVRAAARHRPADLTEYRLTRIAEWSQPRYRLDGRFVALTLLIDQGEESVAGRWAAKDERYDDLGRLLAGVPDPAVVVLGPPGSGKSTVLRRFELDTAIQALRGGEEDGEGGQLTFFIQLNQYTGREGQPPPDPGAWLAERWAERFGDLPALDTLLMQGRMVLLLDALNEMPAASEREMRRQVGLWKEWLVRLVAERPGNRVVFSCRSLDYSQPLSTPALRVPQVQIEPLGDAQVKDFLRVHSPSRWREMWLVLEGSPQLDVLRSPYFLKLLTDQVEATGEIAAGRAELFTGFVRQALKREVERGGALFATGDLLTSRDRRRLAAWQWASPWDLPERGMLVPKLAALAHGMQARAMAGEASQVRIGLDDALDLLDSEAGEAIVAAGESLAVLDEDQAAEALMYVHQLVQEYFAARMLAKAPNPELVATPWRAVEIRPSVRELLETLPPAETLPPLPTTGWEETTVLAAAMTADAEGFVRGVMQSNLALGGRCAAVPAVRERLSAGFVEALRWALVERSRDVEADLRDRIACGLAVGELGDPRFERREGPHGAYLMPPLVEIAGGVYPIGDDAPIEWTFTGMNRTETAHIPRHAVAIAAFQIGRFPVTNAEWRCFMDAGGYEVERWWDTEDARAWRRGELADEGAKVNSRFWRKRFQENPQLFDQIVEEGRFPSEKAVEMWRGWILRDDASFEAALDALWQAKRQTEPGYWQEERYNAASQPVVGVCWYEARAYCDWLSAQTGMAFRLPTEVEWEAAARGNAGRHYAYGDIFDATMGNTIETHLRRLTPVGVFAECDTREGVSDMAGNVAQWTSSAWGGQDEVIPQYGYPYDPTDGREDIHSGPDCPQVMRGGSWDDSQDFARAAYRFSALPSYRVNNAGFRWCSSSPISGGGP